MSLTLSIMILATGELRLLVTFVGLVGSLLIVILWRLLVIGDACFLAWKQASVDLSSRTSRVKSVLVGVTILLLGTYPGPDFLLKRWDYFRAYKISSESMCPTLCVGDRVVAEMDVFRTRSPERGELIVFDHERRGVMFIKRVVGIGGDTVVYGPGNTVSVDGKPLTRLDACGKPPMENDPAPEGALVETVKVPEGSFFVVGDNLANSFDSRIPGFGAVTMQEVRGKPVFIYWSSEHFRIGCKIL